tara:strand:- start:4958 stop:5209 length:252 start_codon:yes stop_codon:yes gene_type:complete
MFIEIIILILGIPVGFLIAWLARDELKAGRVWFRVLVIASILLGIWFWLIDKEVLVWTMGFVLVVSLISLIKSGDKNFVKKNI